MITRRRRYFRRYRTNPIGASMFEDMTPKLLNKLRRQMMFVAKDDELWKLLNQLQKQTAERDRIMRVVRDRLEPTRKRLHK